ncbi:MAG: polysaccharide pyruvyl transferase family protein [Planctomycetota bacterium]
MTTTDRRLLRAGVALLVCLTRSVPGDAAEPGAALPFGGKTVLLHSSWQTVNIGDIAHTPGALELLRRALPGARLILWAARPLDRGVEPMLRRAFPDVEIVWGHLDQTGRTGSESLRRAVESADLLVYGSGPHLHARIFAGWQAATRGKPYGSYGNTIEKGLSNLRFTSLLSDACFIFTRETTSLAAVQSSVASPRNLAFAPDATFGMTLTDDARGQKLQRDKGLTRGKYICVVPRLRKTPYHKIYPDRGWGEAKIREVETLNERWADRDHAKARTAMIRWIRETGGKVLVCPEMTYQLDVMDELLINPLPEDVRSRVERVDHYWLPDEAAAVYRDAVAVLSFECHSPILAFAQGTPAFYLRQPEDTSKGQMWYDLGVAEWVFEIEEVTGEQIASQLIAVHNDPAAAGTYLREAMIIVRERQTASMRIIGDTLLYSDTRPTN